MKPTPTNGNRKEYMVKDLAFTYDALNDLFYAYQEDASVYSNRIVGEFHLELDQAGTVLGVEILHANEVLSEYGITLKMLQTLSHLTMKVVERNRSLIVFIAFQTPKEEKTATITSESPLTALVF